MKQYIIDKKIIGGLPFLREGNHPTFADRAEYVILCDGSFNKKKSQAGAAALLYNYKFNINDKLCIASLVTKHYDLSKSPDVFNSPCAYEIIAAICAIEVIQRMNIHNRVIHLVCDNQAYWMNLISGKYTGGNRFFTEKLVELAHNLRDICVSNSVEIHVYHRQLFVLDNQINQSHSDNILKHSWPPDIYASPTHATNVMSVNFISPSIGRYNTDNYKLSDYVNVVPSDNIMTGKPIIIKSLSPQSSSSPQLQQQSSSSPPKPPQPPPPQPPPQPPQAPPPNIKPYPKYMAILDFNSHEYNEYDKNKINYYINLNIHDKFIILTEYDDGWALGYNINTEQFGYFPKDYGKKIFKVLINYNDIDENLGYIHLNKDDVVMLLHNINEDGWLYGKNINTNKCGWFPYNNVQNDTYVYRQ